MGGIISGCIGKGVVGGNKVGVDEWVRGRSFECHFEWGLRSQLGDGGASLGQLDIY